MVLYTMKNVDGSWDKPKFKAVEWSKLAFIFKRKYGQQQGG